VASYNRKRQTKRRFNAQESDWVTPPSFIETYNKLAKERKEAKVRLTGCDDRRHGNTLTRAEKTLLDGTEAKPRVKLPLLVSTQIAIKAFWEKSKAILQSNKK
jgi:hypothetical protein